jgi:hypothetical protein
MPDALLVLLEIICSIAEGACGAAVFTSPTVPPREPTGVEREVAALRAFEAVRCHDLYDAELDHFRNV